MEYNGKLEQKPIYTTLSFDVVTQIYCTYFYLPSPLCFYKKYFLAILKLKAIFVKKLAETFRNSQHEYDGIDHY